MTKPKGKPEPELGPVPKAVVSRLSLYLRELQRLIREGNQTTSSTQLGRLLGFTDAQVRKDLAYFGQFGYPGIGYRCEELVTAIRAILGTSEAWAVGMVGIGNLGRALLRYRGFETQGFRIAAAFDVDETVIGKRLGAIEVFHLDRLAEITSTMQIRLGMIAVPAHAAQSVADRMIEVGLAGILNFAPVTISVPEHVSLVGVDLAMELEQLTFAVNRLQEERSDAS